MTARVNRCCMCPNVEKPLRVCPGGHLLHPNPTPCDFVMDYVMPDGREITVGYGIGYRAGRFRARFRDTNGKLGRFLECVPWRESFDRAQEDLNVYAQAHRLKER